MNTRDSPVDNDRLANSASSGQAMPAARDEVAAREPSSQEQLHRLRADFVNFRRRVSNISEQAANDRTSDNSTYGGRSLRSVHPRSC